MCTAEKASSMYWTSVYFGMLLLLGISDDHVFGSHHILAGGYAAADEDGYVRMAAILLPMIGLVLIALLFGHSVFLVQRFKR